MVVFMYKDVPDKWMCSSVDQDISPLIHVASSVHQHYISTHTMSSYDIIQWLNNLVSFSISWVNTDVWWKSHVNSLIGNILTAKKYFISPTVVTLNEVEHPRRQKTLKEDLYLLPLTLKTHSIKVSVEKVSPYHMFSLSLAACIMWIGFPSNNTMLMTAQISFRCWELPICTLECDATRDMSVKIF